MDAVVGSPFGRTTLAAYLPSRTAELTIHSVDIADALALDLEPPSEALAETLRHVANAAVGNGRGREMLRALSGRGVLPPGFNVY